MSPMGEMGHAGVSLLPSCRVHTALQQATGTKRCSGPAHGGYMSPDKLHMKPHRFLGHALITWCLQKARQHLPCQQLCCRCLQHTWALAEKTLPELECLQGRLKGLQAPKNRCPQVPKAETCSLFLGLRQVHGCSKTSVVVPAKHPWAPQALLVVVDSQSPKNTLPGPASPMSSWLVTEVPKHGAETCKLQKKQSAQKDPSTDVGGEVRFGRPAGLGPGSQTRHCPEGESLSWDKDTPEPISGLRQKGCQRVKSGPLDVGLQQHKRSSSCCSDSPG